MNKRCIINVAVREPYTILQKRLLASLEPFKKDFDIISWTDTYPPGSSTLHETYYGFKVHALQHAIDLGYTQILWLDAACYAVRNPKVFFDIIEEQGYYFTGGGPVLSDWCSDYYLDLYNEKRENVKEVQLLSGSIYGFNLETEIGKSLFKLLKADETRGLFMNCYTDDSARIDGHKVIGRTNTSINPRCDTVPSHRHDEASLSYFAWYLHCKLDLGDNNTGYFQGSVIRANKNTGQTDFITIDEHTFEKSLLHKTSKVLDCGARGFGFSQWIADNIMCSITAIDADREIIPPKISNLTYIHAAVTCPWGCGHLGEEAKEIKYFSFGNGTGSYTEEVGPQPTECECYFVPAYEIQPGWDLIKMDIEGAEYDILMGMTEPLAKQISVEFHEHTVAKRGDEFMKGIFHHLGKWYDIYNDVKEPRHGCEPNYWDVLFILKNTQ